MIRGVKGFYSQSGMLIYWAFREKMIQDGVFMDKLIKPLAFLTILVLACSALVRIFSAGETLTEYADNNPEIAYATPGPSANPEADSGSSPENVPSDEAGTEDNRQYGTATASLGAGAVLFSEYAVMSSSDIHRDADISSASGDTGYESDFYYEPLSEDLIARITGISYPVSQEAVPALSFRAVNIVPDEETLAVSYEDLRHLMILHYDFNGDIQTGELICNKGIAQDLLEIFYELFLNEYRIEKISLIEEYEGDDTASMLDNNTSCFNYRVVDGTENLSKHALGCAIDINPFYNPYVVFGKGEDGGNYISPPGSEKYADRSWDFPYKIDENDLCYRLFKAHGFTWGGDWNSCKDYQHFQKAVY